MMRRRILGISVVVAVLLAVGPLGSWWTPVRGETDEPPRPDQTLGSPRSASRSDFLAQIHRALTTQHNRMIELANQMLGAGVDPQRPENRLVNQRTATQSAEAAYQHAKLTREVAEIAVTEYGEGIFVEDKATADYEVDLARSDVDSKRIVAEGLKEQLAKIERASNGSATDLAIEFRRRDSIVDSQRGERKARLEVEKAESKRRMLIEYTKPIRLRELQAAVAKARSEELAKRATFEMETAEQERLAAAVYENEARRGIELAGVPGGIPGPASPRDEDRVLALLDNAITIEDRLRAKLGQVKKEGNPGSLLMKEIRDLAGQLQAIVEEAEAGRSALQFDRLKARIHRAASQAGFPAK